MELPRWQLEDILDPKDTDRIIAEIEARVAKIETLEKRFSSTMPAKLFADTIIELERINRALSKIGSYASDHFNENTKDQAAIAFKNRIEALGADCETKLLFIDQRWKRFDEKNAARLLKTTPAFGYYLRKLRALRPHTLSEAEEKVVTIKDVNGVDALGTVFSILTDGFTYLFDGKEVGVSELQRHWRSPDASVRKAAYTALLEKYQANKEVLAEIYTHIADDWRREAALRTYPGPISVRNKANDLPDEAVRALLNVCRKNSPVFQEYFRKKAKILKMPRLTRFDLYAPLGKDATSVPYEQAVAKTLAAMREFHPRFEQGARRIVEQGHIHARPQKSKYTGAYCDTPAPDVTPYILLNYTGEANSVKTLAHELGHGVHSILAEHHHMFHQHAPLPVAETASTFAELLLHERLRKEDPKLARTLAMMQLDDFYATIGRQSWFVIFEETAHEMIGRHASGEELSATYLSQLREQFGSAVDVPELFQNEWLYIPHIFHSPFYCYAYSYAEKIVDLFGKGGSESPGAMVKAAGFDVADERFWQSGFDVIRQMIDEL